MFGRRKHRDHALAEPSTARRGGEGVATIDDDSFLASTEGGYTLVDFWAPWCGPCRARAPVFEDVAARSTGGVRIVVPSRSDLEQAVAVLGLPAGARHVPSPQGGRP